MDFEWYVEVRPMNRVPFSSCHYSIMISVYVPTYEPTSLKLNKKCENKVSSV